MALRTGTPDGAEDLTSEPVVALVRAGETWAALGSGGGLVGYGRRRERLWSVKVPASATALRGAGAARIVLGSPDGSLIGLDATTGSPAWKTSLEGKLLALSESESGGEVILATVDRDPGGTSAVAIHARGGIVLWQIPLSPGESASAHFQGQKLLVSSPGLGIKASGGVRDPGTARALLSAGATRLGASASVASVRQDPAAGSTGGAEAAY